MLLPLLLPAALPLKDNANKSKHENQNIAHLRSFDASKAEIAPAILNTYPRSHNSQNLAQKPVSSVPKYTPALGGWAGSGGRIHPEFLHLTYTLSQNSQNLQQNKLNKNLPSHSSPFPGRGGTTDPEYRIPPLSKHATEQVDLKSAIMQYTPPGAIGG